MDAKARSLTFMADAGLLKVPFFQRPYVWTEDNWEELLTDLFNFRKTHFLGSLILKQQETLTGEAKETLVVDGQQRLTTMSILLKALYDSFPNDLKANCKNSIRTHLFHKKQQTDKDYLVRIEHSHVDSKSYEETIRKGIDGDTENKDLVDGSRDKILGCYKYFERELQNKNEEERKNLFNRLLQPESKILVVIDLAQADDEQAIFDTINSAGVRLSSSDIIKNALFQKAIQILDQKEAIKLYDATWKKSFIADQESVEYWDSERLTGRLKRDNIEILLHCIAVIKGFYDPDKHSLSDLAQLYKAKIRHFAKDELLAFIYEIKEYAQIYRERIVSFYRSTLLSFEDSSKRLLHILEVLQVSTFHPYILFVFKNHSSEAVEILTNLEKFVVRRMISKQETKSYNKFCKEFIEDRISLQRRISETSDEHVFNGLCNIANKDAALILFWIELLRRHNDKKHDLREFKYNYSLEHIMPQAWEEYWGDMPEKKNPDGQSMSQEVAKTDRASKIYWIGNMTLLTSSLNSSLRNYPFDKKMNGEGRKKGIKAYSELSITKTDIVEKYDSGDKVWDEGRIVERTRNLFLEFKQIWGT